MSGNSEAILAQAIFPSCKGTCVRLDNKPKLSKLKLICVTALISLILLIPAYSLEEENTNSPISVDEKSTRRSHKYPIEELQQRAIELSPEIAVIDQAIKVMKSKKWTALAPNVGIGNNFASRNKDIRFNVNFDVVEMLGGGKIREINLDVAQLELRKLELESKLKIQVLEYVLALERAERNYERIEKKLTMLHRRTRLLDAEYETGSRELDSVMKYWEIEEDLEKNKLETLDQVELERVRLEELVGVF
jgi:hypothetical protein